MTPSSVAAAPVVEPFPPASYAWFAVGALSLVNMVSYVERQILTLLFAPIKRDFHLTDTEVSLLAGAAFVIFFVLFGLLFGRLADRGNRKRIILLGALFWSLATTSCGLAQNFIHLFVARISVGIGEASLSPSALSTISDYFPREKLTRAISFYTGAQYVGAGLALVVGGFAIHLVAQLPPIDLPGLGVLRPWQMTFVFVGLGGMLFAIPMLFVREPVRRGMAAPVSAEAKAAQRSQLVSFFSANRRMLACHFMGFSLSSMLGFGVASWVPTYFIRVHHWAAQDIGYAYGAIMAFMGLSGALVGGRIAEWMEGRGVKDVYFVMPMITASTNMVLFVSAMFAPSATVALALLTLSVFVGTLPLSLIMASLQAVAPNQLRGQLVALFSFVANILGVASGPTVVALLTDYVYRDEQAVGLSLATTSLVITPIVVAIWGFGRPGLRHSLDRANELYRTTESR
ncbi:MAG: MFS transporter [Alphaproteobacteria bacterium]|nr:MFS transporter [Alphaproteobacteria bacterium]MBU1514335.1 MFS transporter [Alphaproteobacteria bacterium]MBU2095979.1 MFS transporter [Alphaproteobacteria bacterium]MBU2153077.1 MFS transporter [Alphaproteobacteria bacterium]MBU2308534.1 MFS transporter [Alphaproteobacteria bacterium]